MNTGFADTVYLGIQLNNQFCYVVEGSAGIPSFASYKGYNKIKAVQAFDNLIKDSL